ncbi:MAG: hypothetical protein QXL85_07280 [Candidatus Bathyarchaeia archaeon]
MLPKDIKEGIAKLLLWSYWAAIQSVHHIEEPLHEPLIRSIDKSKFLDFVRQHERTVAECERTILEIRGAWIMSGERIFHDYVRNPGEQIYMYLPLKEPEKILKTSVFNEFCQGIIRLCLENLKA